MIDYKQIVEDFQSNLNCEIDHGADPFFFQFILARYAKGQVTDDDLTEIKGYRNGLKFAREMLQRIINIAEEMEGADNDN